MRLGMFAKWTFLLNSSIGNKFHISTFHSNCLSTHKCFYQNIVLGKIGKYSHVVHAFTPFSLDPGSFKTTSTLKNLSPIIRHFFSPLWNIMNLIRTSSFLLIHLSYHSIACHVFQTMVIFLVWYLNISMTISMDFASGFPQLF
jgi:hypothetical protein